MADPPTQRRPDRWAHRRAEPRPLALLWTTFLAAATVVMLTSLVVRGGADHDIYRPAARALLALTAVGLTILWPMVRLSQLTPPEGARQAIAKDLVVVLAPVQAIIWPQMFVVLAQWPLEVVGALSAMLTAWTVLTGAILAMALGAVDPDSTRRPGIGARALWMGVFIALVGCGPLLGLVASRGPGLPENPGQVSAWLLTSPMTAVFEIARDRPWSGWAADVGAAHWWAIGIVALAGVAAWTLVSFMPARARTPAPSAGGAVA